MVNHDINMILLVISSKSLRWGLGGMGFGISKDDFILIKNLFGVCARRGYGTGIRWPVFWPTWEFTLPRATLVSQPKMIKFLWACVDDFRPKNSILVCCICSTQPQTQWKPYFFADWCKCSCRRHWRFGHCFCFVSLWRQWRKNSKIWRSTKPYLCSHWRPPMILSRGELCSWKQSETLLQISI